MLQLILRRLALFIPMLFLMSVVAFLLIQAPPGDYLTEYVAVLRETGEAGRKDIHSGGSGAGAIEIQALEERFGLDRPLYIQYLKWIGGVVQGDMGMSMEWRIPVNELIKERVVLTLILSGATILFAWTLAIPIGIISAVKQYSIIDYAFTFLAYIGVGTPNFMLALVIMWTAFAAFGLRLTGLFSPEYVDAPWSVGRFVDMMSHMWVPVLILGTDGTARFTRIIRANLLDELGSRTWRRRAPRAYRRRGLCSGTRCGWLEPIRQHGWVGPAAALLGQPDRGHGHVPADHRSAAAVVSVVAGHVPGGVVDPHPDGPDVNGHIDLGPDPGLDGPSNPNGRMSKCSNSSCGVSRSSYRCWSSCRWWRSC